MGENPVLFTVEFRRKLEGLSLEERKAWLGSLAARFRDARGSANDLLLAELREVARSCRIPLVQSVEKQLGPFASAHLEALLEVPRERFVRPEDIERSADDTPLPLDEGGLATISAPHAYVLSYRLLNLGPGDALVELGTGCGYGAALAAFIAGPRGRIITFEIDPLLAAEARKNLASGGSILPRAEVQVFREDAMVSASRWQDSPKVVVTFAVASLPSEWLRALPEGGVLVAPVGPSDSDQRLVLASKRHGRVLETSHGAVRYVRNRSTG